MSEFILHHYDFSPFSEKIRLIFGLKRLAWQSVTIPSILPKPDLLPLTGGYRHTPVLQIGADIFCDTRLIAREIDRRCPEPPLWEKAGCGFTAAIEAWAEGELFWSIGRYVSGLNAELLDPQLHVDRALMRGKRAPSMAVLKATAMRSLAGLRAEIPRVENMLSDGRLYLLANAPGLADFSVYHCLWFLSVFPKDCADEFRQFPRIVEWMARIAAVGHGGHQDLDSKAALLVAKESTPEPVASSIADDTAPPLGSRVAVSPEGYTTAPVEGELVLVLRNEIGLRRVDPLVGEVVVHFPRLGYRLKVCNQS